jgi:hypothetical protein
MIVPNRNLNAMQAVPIAPAPSAPRCGRLLQLGNVMVPWVGGGAAGTATEIHQPVSSLAYRANDLSTALKVEKACTEGLPEGRHLTAPGLTDMTTAVGSVTFAEWLYMIRMALIERGLDSVFRATINNEEVFLLEKWGQATKEVVDDQITFLNANGDEYDRKNLALSAKFILKSLSIDMLRRTESEIGNGLDQPANGLEVFSAVIALHSVLNDSTERHYVTQLQKLKLVKEPGENVMTFTDKVLGLARHINGISSNTNDLHVLIYSTMTGSSNEVFKTTVATLLSSCSNPINAAARITARNWESNVSMLRGLYRNLVSEGNWEAIIHKKEEHEPQGLAATTQGSSGTIDSAKEEAYKVEIQRLTKIVNGGASQNSGGNSWTPICHDCGEKGHTRPNCPHRTNANQASANGFNKKSGPSAGEPMTKTHQGTAYKWCDTCKKWNSGAKAHLTSEHIKGKGAATTTTTTPNAALAEAAPSSSATLAFVSGYMGAITETEGDPFPFDAETKFIFDNDGHGSILSSEGVHSNHPHADYCPFCQQHFPENSGHNQSNLHLKNVQIMRAWESSIQQLEFCTESLYGMVFIREGTYSNDMTLNGTFEPEEVLPEEALPEEVVPEDPDAEDDKEPSHDSAFEDNQEVDEEGFIKVVRKSKRVKRTYHLNSNAGQR